MIKKYATLCLISIPIFTSTADNPLPRRIPEIFFIDQDNTVKMQTIQEGMERLKQEIKQETNATLSKHEQEHKAQQARMRQENEKNITKYQQMFMSKYDENDIRFKNQLNEMNREVREANKELKEKEIKLYRSIFYGAFTVSEIAALITGYNTGSWSIGISLTSINVLVGSGCFLLEKILTPPSQSAPENKDDETIKVDEETHA